MSTYYPDWFGWKELPEICRFCRMPLHTAKEHPAPFCPNCAADKETARSGRELLKEAQERHLLREAEKNEEIEQNRKTVINRLMGYGG